MNFTLKVLVGVALLTISIAPELWASGKTTCNSYTKEELSSIKESSNSDLIMGAGVLEMILKPESTSGRELLKFGSRIESPKRVATLSLIVYQLSNDSPLKQFQDSITRLLQSDKDNAFPYYLNALLLHEEGRDQEALDQIRKGNKKIFDSYPKERFAAIEEAAMLAKCNVVQARQYAFYNLPLTTIYMKLRHLSKKLIDANGQEAKKACLLMGQNLEQGSLTCIEKLNSLIIQNYSMDDLDSNSTDRMKIKNKRKQALECGGRHVEISEADVSEVAANMYYEILFRSGEAAAQDFLADFVKQRKSRK